MRYVHTGHYCDLCECDIPPGKNYLCEACEELVENFKEEE